MIAENTKRNVRVLGGREVPVVVTPRLGRGAPAVMGSARSLMKGMRLTGSYLRPSKVVTKQYPENRRELRLPERFRARLRLVEDAEGHHLCTGCKLCVQVCPVNAIEPLFGPVEYAEEALPQCDGQI